MEERAKKILGLIKSYSEKGIDFDGVLKKEFEALPINEQKEVSSLFLDSCAERTWESAKKDKRVAERIAKAVKILKKSGI